MQQMQMLQPSLAIQCRPAPRPARPSTNPSPPPTPNFATSSSRRRPGSAPPSSSSRRKTSRPAPSSTRWAPCCPTSTPRAIPALGITAATRTSIRSSCCARRGRWRPFTWIPTNGASMCSRSLAARPTFRPTLPSSKRTIASCPLTCPTADISATDIRRPPRRSPWSAATSNPCPTASTSPPAPSTTTRWSGAPSCSVPSSSWPAPRPTPASSTTSASARSPIRSGPTSCRTWPTSPVWCPPRSFPPPSRIPTS
mmetsp:Transcript_1082/g.3055  ORF Transcript_1082/g.3055 Transcript_1082/m.3055 type:complete len:254 (-) Transcript_1082:264-1025(-)